MQNVNVAADTPINTEAINDLPGDDGRTIEGVVTEVKGPDPAMAVLDPAGFAQILFQPFVDELASTKRSASRTKYDPTTPAGLAKAKEFMTTFQKIRTRAEKKKVEFKKPLDLAGKKILEHYNAIADSAEVEEKKHSDVIEAEKRRLAAIAEEKQRLERVRIEAIEGRIEAIRLIPSTLARADAATIAAELEQLVTRVLTVDDYEEHLEQAIGALNNSINDVRQMLTDARGREAIAAELERLRAAEEQRRKDDEARAAAAAAIQRQQEEAAATMKAQQEQMAAIIEVQGLANALHADGLATDRTAILLAIGRARVFDPSAFGAMAPMASLARDAALPLLEDLLANLPAPAVVVPIEADDTGVVVGAAVLASEPARLVVTERDAQDEAVVVSLQSPVEQARAAADKSAATWLTHGVRVVPAVQRPSDFDLLELVAVHYRVPNAAALAWLSTFDAAAVRAALAGV